MLVINRRLRHLLSLRFARAGMIPTYNRIARAGVYSLIIDVGVGPAGSKFLYRNFKRSQIVSIDPMIEHRKSIPVQYRNKFICVALGNMEGTAVLNIAQDSGDSFISNAQIGERNARGSRHVRMTTLDRLVSSPEFTEYFGDLKQHTVLMKIDVEGFELQVLEGSKDSLRYVNSVVVEVFYDQILTETFGKICSLLQTSGFQVGGVVKASLSSADFWFVQCGTSPQDEA